MLTDNSQFSHGPSIKKTLSWFFEHFVLGVYSDCAKARKKLLPKIPNIVPRTISTNFIWKLISKPFSKRNRFYSLWMGPYISRQIVIRKTINLHAAFFHLHFWRLCVLQLDHLDPGDRVEHQVPTAVLTSSFCPSLRVRSSRLVLIKTWKYVCTRKPFIRLPSLTPPPFLPPIGRGGGGWGLVIPCSIPWCNLRMRAVKRRLNSNFAKVMVFKTMLKIVQLSQYFYMI